ncbi:hypothetical protein H2198_005985 [Neophaeococcomyces mojaviensis]|uniref:Uncharacterized protein n=1 Tax=Neophaeococcomyces mojaviensis TaxID=3383035 RepID=A0ACC3A417_9EURO|nr:hypothetical protein H2198_005985 [Knufia sp. JES_112]
MAASQSKPKFILVTGGNRGIGFAIVKSLAQCADLDQASTTILMGCRNLTLADSAVAGLNALGGHTVRPILLDVASDDSIRNATSHVEQTYGHLDVLVNNAGYASMALAPDFSDLRSSFQDVYNVNVSSAALVTRLFLPLLRKSIAGKVIQVSSARGSLTKISNNELPPTAALSYSVSKAALNALTLLLAQEPENSRIEFQMAGPGHCKTRFNNFRGLRDPEEGANVVVELVIGERRPTAHYETVGTSRELVVIPW